MRTIAAAPRACFNSHLRVGGVGPATACVTSTKSFQFSPPRGRCLRRSTRTNEGGQVSILTSAWEVSLLRLRFPLPRRFNSHLRVGGVSSAAASSRPTPCFNSHLRVGGVSRPLSSRSCSSVSILTSAWEVSYYSESRTREIHVSILTSAWEVSSSAARNSSNHRRFNSHLRVGGVWQTHTRRRRS